MRFSLSSAALIAALPAISVAADADANTGSIVDQYKAQFQNFMGKLGGYVQQPAPEIPDPVAAVEAKVGSMQISRLSLDNWSETLYSTVKPGATEADEWWVLLTGGNKTCLGRCDKIEQVFNETAGRFAILPNAPHMATLNCDEQPVLCNSWSATPGAIWAFEMLPPPAAIDIHRSRLNLTSTTSDDLVALHTDGKTKMTPLDSWFHPFNGKAVEFGLAVPFGYAMWAFGMVPNWAFMIIVSMVSRSMMSNRFQPPRRPDGPPAAAAGAQ